MRRDRTRRPLGLVGALGLAVVFFPTTAAAQAEEPRNTGSCKAPDVVFLPSGELVRGRLTEVVPGDHVTIVVQDCTSRTLRWNEVRDLVKPPPQSPPAPRPVVDPLSSAGKIGGLTLIIAGSSLLLGNVMPFSAPPDPLGVTANV